MYPDDGGLREPVRKFEETVNLRKVVRGHFLGDGGSVLNIGGGSAN